MAATDRQNGSVVDAVFGASAIVSTTAPTAAELGALTDIECGIVSGPDTPRNGSTIDISGLCDEENRKKAGPTDNGDITITLWREFDGTDAFWTLFDDATQGTQYLVIARGGWTTTGTPTAADICDVYTVEVMSREPGAPVRGEAQRFTVMLAVTQVDFDAVVAA